MKYNKVERFKYTTSKILPSVYDDSLSYSELLAKVISYLNTTITNVDEFKKFLDGFIEKFDTKLKSNVYEFLQLMYDNGDLKIIIDEFINEKSSEIDVTLEEIKTQLAQQLTQIESDLELRKINRGNVTVNDINTNLGKFDESFFSDEVKQQWAGNTPIHSTPSDRSITTIKMVKDSITPSILDETVSSHIGYRYNHPNMVEIGTIGSQNGINAPFNEGNRLRTLSGQFIASPVHVDVRNGYKASVFKYSKDGTFLETTGWQTEDIRVIEDVYVRVILSKVDDSFIDEDDIQQMLSHVKITGGEPVEFVKEFEQGSLSSTNGSEGTLAKNRIKSKGLMRLNSPNDCVIFNRKPELIDIAVIFYDENLKFISGTGWYDKPMYRFSDSVTRLSDDEVFELNYPIYFKVAVRYKNDDIITPIELPNPIHITTPNEVADFETKANTFLKKPISHDIKTGSKGRYIFKFPVDMGGSYLSSSCMVGDELWSFPVSNDTNTNYVEVQRNHLDFEEKSAVLRGTFEHNWGHVNSVSYNRFTDSLILGNGSGAYSLYGKILIFENASTFKERERVDVSEAIIIDVTNFGVKANVVWGEHNNEKGNICYVITNDNKNIRKLLLGQGSNQLASGTFISGKTGLQYNGTYIVLASYEQEDGDDVNQGSHYVGGRLYLGLGHSTLWYSVNTLHDDGSITKEMVKETFYKADGSVDSKTMQGITITDNHIIVGLQKHPLNEIYVYGR